MSPWAPSIGSVTNSASSPGDGEAAAGSRAARRFADGFAQAERQRPARLDPLEMISLDPNDSRIAFRGDLVTAGDLVTVVPPAP
jgi:hypothetical protein